MSELGSLYRNITETQLVKSGAGLVKGFVVNSHSSGTLKLEDGVDTTDGVQATSTLTTSGIVYAVFAENTLTISGNFSEGETVTIDSTVYQFLATPLAAYDINIGSTAAESLDFLKLAINATGTGDGSDYFAGTLAHPTVIATTNAATTQKVVARLIGTASNAEATTETGSVASWADTTLGGGTGASVAGVATASSTFVIDGATYYFTNQLSEDVETAVANEILWVTNDATALDNMKLAINGSGTEGTNYSTGTNAHPTVIATTNANTTQIIEAKVFGSLGNAITTTETMTTTAWTGATLAGGTDASRTILNTYTPATGSSVITFPDGINFVNGLYATVAGTSADITVIYN